MRRSKKPITDRGLNMMARLSDELCLLSIKEFLDYEIIDGGDTIVVRFEGADCQVVGVMMSRRVLHGMIGALADLPPRAEPPNRLPGGE